MKNNLLKSALAFGTIAISTEHFFSASLSSPVTVKQMKQNPKDVRQGYIVAIVLSMVIAITLSLILRQWLPLLTAVVICVVYVYLYERALAGKDLIPFLDEEI